MHKTFSPLALEFDFDHSGFHPDNERRNPAALQVQ